MAREACTKYLSRVKRALEMKQGADLWVVMGKTSAWSNSDNSVITPSPSDVTVVEPFLAMKPMVKSLAVEVSGSAYDQLQDSFRAAVSIEGVVTYLELVDDADAYGRLARYLYIKALYDPAVAGHPNFTSFRVYYLVSGLVPSAGYENATWLVPEHISDYGMMEYENAGPAILGGTAIVLPIVLEFR